MTSSEAKLLRAFQLYGISRRGCFPLWGASPCGVILLNRKRIEPKINDFLSPQGEDKIFLFSAPPPDISEKYMFSCPTIISGRDFLLGRGRKKNLSPQKSPLQENPPTGRVPHLCVYRSREKFEELLEIHVIGFVCLPSFVRTMPPFCAF